MSLLRKIIKNKSSRLFSGICLIVLTTSCQKEPPILPTENLVPAYTTYTIDSGAHYSDKNDFRIVTQTSLKFSASFDDSAIYTAQIAANQHDVHKLYGFSDCGTHHQENSARFGWNWKNDSLRIYAYVYRNKSRIIKEITSVKLGENNNYGIDKQNGKYTFTVNGQFATVIEAGCNSAPVGYQLYPYFGGDETAPHRVSIRIREL